MGLSVGSAVALHAGGSTKGASLAGGALPRRLPCGAYKQINTVGVACIVALVNMDRSLQLPFVFGGDGANFAVPDSHIGPALSALRGA